MGTKTITIKDEVYDRLKRLKKEGESFTELIDRLIEKRSILELSELTDKKEAKSLENTMKKGSKERKEARKKNPENE